jgi:hypothetical protein
LNGEAEGFNEKNSAQKTLGDALRVPCFYFALSALTFSSLLTSSRLSSWLPCFLFSLSIVQSSSQRSFVAIVECIESLKNYVKQKMVDVSCSLSSTSREKSFEEGYRERFAMRSSEKLHATNFPIT